MATTLTQTRMVADVGGTNTRIAFYDPGYDDFRHIASFVNREYSQFQDIVAQWLAGLDETAPSEACLAVAALPVGDQVTMSNMNWSFSGRALASRFGFSRLAWINDFEANAYSLPHLRNSERTVLQAGVDIQGRLATMGPGTGLGGATIDVSSATMQACAAEPGHMGLSPGTELELELFRLLLPRHGNIYAELLVSGPGLQRLYEALGEINGQVTEAIGPEAISSRALAGDDALCELALGTFCKLLGSACGDFVLATGAYGGLYLAGGIAPRILPFLRRSEFLQRFRAKGVMATHLEGVRVYAITAAHPGLTGAAHAPLNEA